MDKYFAASNSAQGFFSYYDECFSSANKLYIIKGGPGTGKSGFMRRAASFAEVRGHYVEYFFCSSDPNSLDGIIVHKGNKKIAVLDGTSPHLYDMTYPGVRDNIINLGDAWSERVLDRSRDAVLSLCKDKSAAYTRAYDALASCGNLYAVIESYISGFLIGEKMSMAARRLVEKYGVHGGGNVDVRLVDCVSMVGRVRFDTFERTAQRIVIVGDTYGAGHKMLECVRRELDAIRADYFISYDPVIPKKINAIFERGGKVAYILSDPRISTLDGSQTNYVNVKRFIGDGAVKVKGDLKYAFSLYKSSMALAEKHLTRARDAHFALEEIYKGAMDFTVVDEKISKFCKDVL